MSDSAPPLAFQPPRVYVLKQVWDHPLAARRAERVIAACPGARAIDFTYADYPDIVIDEGWDRFPRMGQLDVVPPPIPVLGLFRFDEEAVRRDADAMAAAYKNRRGKARNQGWERVAGGQAFQFFCSGIKDLRPNPFHVCRPQWRIHQGRGCPHQCAYCGLGGQLLSHVNTEEYIERLGDLIRRNPWQKTWLYDDAMDILTLEPQLDSLAPLMRFFESTKDYYLIIHTKSDRVEGVLEAGAPGNTIIAWSLSGPTQSTRLERAAGTTETRIEAARRCQEAGVQIRYKFKPIIPVPNWREEATETINLALTRTQPDNLSMTVLMWMNVETIKACIRHDLIDPEFMEAAESDVTRVQDERTAPFPHAMREKVYRHYLAEIRRRDPEIPVTISTESLAMWKSLGKDLGFTPKDYVCGCGAGAVPGLKRLETDPWQDAREALTWDGRPAAPAY